MPPQMDQPISPTTNPQTATRASLSPPQDHPRPGPVTCSQRGVFKPKSIFNLHTTTTKSPLPRTLIAALRDHNWKLTMDAEYDALIENKTWEIVPRPPGANVIRSMWIFAHKNNADGSFERLKARLVGDGKTQQVGVDCGETFSPVVKPTTMRTILSLAISKNWAINQLDVKNAFLHGALNETIYMHQSLG